MSRISLPALTTAACFASFTTGAHASDEGDPDVRFKPISLTTQLDVGQIVHGKYDLTGANTDGQFLQRTGVWLTQETVIKERFDLKMGVGGLFWYAYPEQEKSIHTKRTQFGPGISEAGAVYRFGDLGASSTPSAPSVQLSMGLFAYKYNEDAEDLGEYLLRSGTYPGYVVTGGWNWMARAGYMVQGAALRVKLLDGRFVSDFLMPMERDMPPMFDISPTYIGSLQLGPALELGAGISWNHGIPVKPSNDLPHDPENRQWIRSGDTLVQDSTGFYTFQGVKLMGRMSLDVKPLLGGMPGLGAKDLRIFTEAAVLGVKDYPYFYEHIRNRIPVMAGINLPAFKLLDILSVQAEYYNTKFKNDIVNAYEDQIPIWHVQDNDANNFNADSSMVGAAEKWKWSVTASRHITKGLRIYAKAASDHFRPVDYNVKNVTVPITTRPGEWYYLVRFEFGI